MWRVLGHIIFLTISLPLRGTFIDVFRVLLSPCLRRLLDNVIESISVQFPASRRIPQSTMQEIPSIIALHTIDLDKHMCIVHNAQTPTETGHCLDHLIILGFPVANLRFSTFCEAFPHGRNLEPSRQSFKTYKDAPSIADWKRFMGGPHGYNG